MIFPQKYIKLLNFQNHISKIANIFLKNLHKNVKKHLIYEFYGQNFIKTSILADFTRKNLEILKYRT